MTSKEINEVGNALREQGELSEQVVTALVSQNREVEVADLSKSYDDPVFSCFLIDESGSMEPYKQNVIDGQSEMLEILRKSNKCKKGALYVVQYLFSDEANVLNQFAILSPDGVDNVIALKSGNYNPGGCTALYKSLFYLLQDMAVNIASTTDQGLASSFTIGVITDGADNPCDPSQRGEPEKIRAIIQELHNKGFLRSSVIIGLTNPDFTSSNLEELKTRLGFQQAISLSQDPREIRRAFVLASQSAVSGQGQ